MTDSHHNINMLSEEEIKKEVRSYFDKNFTSLSEAARHYGCSIAYLSYMNSGKRPPSRRLLSDMGFEKKTVYMKARG